MKNKVLFVIALILNFGGLILLKEKYLVVGVPSCVLGLFMMGYCFLKDAEKGDKK